MLSKKNVQMMNQKGQPIKQRFGLRKLTIGVASVLLGLTFMGASSASADEVANQGQEVIPTELPAVQSAEITTNENTEQVNNDEVVSNSSAETTPVSSEATSQVVADSAAAVQTPVSDAHPVTSATPGNSTDASSQIPAVSESSDVSSNVPSASDEVVVPSSAPTSDPTSDSSQENQVEIKFQDVDNFNLVLNDPIYIPGAPGTKVTMDEIKKYLPANLIICDGQDSEFIIDGNLNQSISIFVRHATEVRDEIEKVEQIIYGNYGTTTEVLNRQEVTFTRKVKYDLYTGTVIEIIEDWQPSLTFNDYTVVPKDGYSPEQTVVQGSTVNNDSGPVTINVRMQQNKVTTEDKEITRTIIVYLPDGTTKEIKQTVTFTHTVTINPWTNKVINDEWTTGNNKFEGREFGEVDGVMPDKTSVAEMTVTPDTESSVVEIRYPQNKTEIDKRTVTRTIKLILPNGTIDYVRQTAVFTRQIIKNANGEIISYGAWNEDGIMLNDYRPAEIDGKKPDITYIHRLVVNPDSENSEVVVRYEAAYKTETEPKEVNRVIYLHHPNGDVTTTTQTVTLYRDKVINLQTGEVTYGDWTTGQFEEYVTPTVGGYVADIEKLDATAVDENTVDQVVNIHYLAHQVTNKTETVNRVITVTMPDGSKKTTTQTVTFKKQVTKHPVTGEVISETEWAVDGDAGWAAFTPDKIDGYTPNIDKVEAFTPDVNTKDQQINISYQENKVETSQTTVTRTIKLILPDGTIQLVRQPVTFTYEKIINPWTGETISENWREDSLAFEEYQVPEIDGKKPSMLIVPSQTVTPDTKDFEVEVRYEAAYTTETESKEVNRVIYLHHPNGDVTTTTQTVTLHRDKVTNLQTGEVTYSDWSTGQFEEYVVPPVEGHVSDVDKIDSLVVDENTTNQEHHVNYLAHQVDNKTKTVNRIITVTLPNGSKKTITQTVTFKKQITRHPTTGEVISETEWMVDGNTNWAGYTPDKIDGYTPNIDKVEAFTPDVNAENQQINISYQENKVETSQTTVTRTIKLILPDGTVKEVPQTVTFTYEKIINPWTGEVISENWRENSLAFEEYQVPEIDGKKPSISIVPSQTVTPDSKDFEVEVRYEAAYTTETESKNVNRVIHFHHPDGRTDSITHTVTLHRDKITNLQTGEVTYGNWSTGHFFEEFVIPQIDGHVSDVDKINSLEVNESTADQEHHVNYLAHQVGDETKTVNRIIKVALPDGHLTVVTQTVTFKKQVTRHPINGEIISETEWVVDGNATWEEYTIEKLDGYTPDKEKLEAFTPNANTEDQHVYISYRENRIETSEKTVTRTIKLILPDGTVKEVPQTVTFTYEKIINPWTGETISENWRENSLTFEEYQVSEIDGKKPSMSVVPSQTVTPDSKDFEVEVRYEANYKTETESKDVNRVIHLHHPDGRTETITHTVTLHRDKTTNLQTGEVTYGNWTTGQFEEFAVPSVDGHVADIDKINSSVVDENTADQEHHVNYLAHQVGDETKTVNRVITVTLPDGSKKTITQTVTFKKQVTKHPITGEVISETEWVVDGDSSWAEYIPEKIDGYVPTIEKVEAVTPGVNSEDELVEIGYKPVNPDKPVDPDKPVNPDKPADPENPGSASATTSGSHAAATRPADSDNTQAEAPVASAKPSQSQVAAPAVITSTAATKATANSDVVNVTAGDESKAAQNNNQQLPQTGDKQEPGLVTGTMLVLVTLLLQLLTFGLVKKKKKTE